MYYKSTIKPGIDSIRIKERNQLFKSYNKNR